MTIGINSLRGAADGSYTQAAVGAGLEGIMTWWTATDSGPKKIPGPGLEGSPPAALGGGGTPGCPLSRSTPGSPPCPTPPPAPSIRKMGAPIECGSPAHDPSTGFSDSDRLDWLHEFANRKCVELTTSIWGRFEVWIDDRRMTHSASLRHAIDAAIRGGLGRD